MDLSSPTLLDTSTALSTPSESLQNQEDNDVGSADSASAASTSAESKRSLVSQDIYMFQGTIRENIAFGREGATEAAIVAAAKASEAHEFIATLPQG